MINFGIKFFVSPTLEWHDEHYIFLSSLLSWKSTIFLHLSPNSMLSTSLIIAVCRTHVIMNLENGLTHCEVFVAQWLEHSLSVWEVIMGLNPFGDSDFFLCSTQAHDMMNITFDLFSVQLMFFGKFVSSNWLWLRTTFISLAVMYSSAALAGSVESHILKTTTIQEITMCIHVQ